MAAPLVPIVGSNLIRVGGGMALRSVSFGNALTGLGAGFRLMDLVEDDQGNVYQVVPDPTGNQPDSKFPIPKAQKKKRKVSKYQREFGKQLKKLKKR